MDIIEATYQVTTPLFCGGANNEKAEFRLPSFKGALRFWWRALAWLRLEGDLKKIKAQEAELFGSTDGQAKCLLTATTQTLRYQDKGKKLKDPETEKVVGKGALYLGYGAIHYSKKLEREAINPFKFKVRALFKPSLEDKGGKLKESVRTALMALGLLGGMGSKSRKGYGSLALTELDGESYIPADTQGFINHIGTITNKLEGKGLDQIAPYTAFTSDTDIVVLEGKSGITALKLLDGLGKEMVSFRSNGRKSKGGYRQVLDDDVNPEDRPFWVDHNLMLKAARDKKVSKHPWRVAFGLPHNYYFSSAGKNVGVSATGQLDRRASPLFMHIHPLANDRYAAVVSFLPSKFLPDGTRLKVGISKVNINHKEIWKPINGFLTDLRLYDRYTKNLIIDTQHIDDLGF